MMKTLTSLGDRLKGQKTKTKNQDGTIDMELQDG